MNPREREDINAWINFVLYAVLGKLGEADSIVRKHGQQVRSVARFLRRECPIPSAPLYRGMLLDPRRPYTLDPSFTFVSWSEDRDVAVWFADRRASISEPFTMFHPEARGYLAELPAPRSEVLFHHSWATRAFDDLPSLALRHPHMGENGARQIAWALRTQREVITMPCDGIDPRPATELPRAAFEAIARRLDPPWLDDDSSLTAPTLSQGCGVGAS
jgi:hypothetical protein